MQALLRSLGVHRSTARCTSYATWLLLLGPWMVGCGQNGPDRFRVSGTVTQAGKPVPAGRVVFEPDTSKGNIGPQGFAVIRNGRFDTATVPNSGSIGGPMRVKIDAYDGMPRGENSPPLGTPLIPRTDVRQLELPREDTEFNFELAGDAR